MDSIVRILYPKVSAVIQAETEQPPVRPEPRRLVRAGASGGRLRRDIRRVVTATLELATALSWLARAAKTGVCRRAFERDRRHETKKSCAPQDRKTAGDPNNIARALRAQTQAIRL